MAAEHAASTCTCFEDSRCADCGAVVLDPELWATPYVPKPGKRELYWCIRCGGDAAVTYRCGRCHELSGNPR